MVALVLLPWPCLLFFICRTQTVMQPILGFLKLILERLKCFYGVSSSFLAEIMIKFNRLRLGSLLGLAAQSLLSGFG
eukprot:scaffold285275_cov14-Tisochrysis_lutea.AAC.1